MFKESIQEEVLSLWLDVTQKWKYTFFSQIFLNLSSLKNTLKLRKFVFFTSQYTCHKVTTPDSMSFEWDVQYKLKVLGSGRT